MTAARDYLLTQPPTLSTRRRKTATPTRHHQSASGQTISSRPYQSPPKPSKVTPLPTKPQQIPLALQFLLLVQKSSTTLTFGLVAITLVVYAWTVYAPTLWSQEFSKLKTLQRNERQLASTNESLKNTMAERAEQAGSGLMPPKPDKSIFLSPADVPEIKISDDTKETPGKPFILPTPMAY
ncbi:MAG: hypothetical protein WBM62_16010 [Crocosphaera sp.]